MRILSLSRLPTCGTIDYDIKTGTYVVRTKLGDMEIGSPMTLTPEEFQDYTFQQSLRSYFRQKNEEEYQNAMGNKFNLTDMQFDIGAADRLFGLEVSGCVRKDRPRSRWD